MEAVETVDGLWGLDVEYYFTCEVGNCHDSGWQSEPNYTDKGLDPNDECGYTVKASDIAGNETEPSVVRYATVGDSDDFTPPTPNPMSFDVLPYQDSSGSVTMTATVATDIISAPVQYLFEETSGNPGGDDSIWLSSPVYVDDGLILDNTYCYRVKARDARGNETALSAESCVTVQAQADSNAPDLPPDVFVRSDDVNTVPNYDLSLSGQFLLSSNWYHRIVANVAGITDDVTPAGDIQIRFICITEPALSSEAFVTMPPRPITIADTGGLGVYGVLLPPTGLWQITYIGGTIVYDVNVFEYSGPGRYLRWKICAYDAAMNEICSEEHWIGPG